MLFCCFNPFQVVLILNGSKNRILTISNVLRNLCCIFRAFDNISYITFYTKEKGNSNFDKIVDG